MAVNRTHEPVIIEEFMGLFKRGDPDSCPVDHFSDCVNIKFIESGFETRDGIDTLLQLGNVVRMYNYKMTSGESLIVLDSAGQFWHCLLDGSNTIHGPILTIPEAEDFDIYVSNGNCYITPFKTYIDGNGAHYQKGLEDEFIYVYKGAGDPAKKAAGFAPTQDTNDTGPLFAYPVIAGGTARVDIGAHMIGVTAVVGGVESTRLGSDGIAVVNVIQEDTHIVLNGIPVVAGATERRVYMTTVLNPPDWNPTTGIDLRDQNNFYLALTITDPTTTSALINISDAELVVNTLFVDGASGGPQPTTGAMYIINSGDNGFCDSGIHAIGVVYETDTGYLTAPGPEFYAVQTFMREDRAIEVHKIPVSPDPHVIRKHLVATKNLSFDFNGNNKKEAFSYQFFFIPDGDMDNATTDKTVSFYDADLLDDASHLIDNFNELPAGVNLAEFGGRMVLSGTFDEPSIAYVSAVGEPEAIDQVDGLVEVPIDGNPITMTQQFRGIMYVFKKTRTYAVSDNGDVPSTWEVLALDLGIGCPVHGIAQVLDSGGANIDFLIVCDFSGVMLFNGSYSRPELSYKIQDYWLEIDRNNFNQIQIMNDTVLQRVYISLPNRRILYCDYSYGLDPQNIRWAPWLFDIEVNTISLTNINELLIGSAQLSPSSRLFRR